MYSFNDPDDLSKIQDLLVSKPLSLLGDTKLKYILFMIEKYGTYNVFEIGTFAGGTTFLLATSFPSISVSTIDINQFVEYFKQPGHDRILEDINSRYPEFKIQDVDIVKIQKLYQQVLPNATFLSGSLSNVDISRIDAVIIDGDHTDAVLSADLEYCYKNMKRPGLIFVDDCVHLHIQNRCKEFCKEHNLTYQFDVYCDYVTIKGYDICVIEIR